MHRYIEMLDDEIERLVSQEKAQKRLNYKTEEVLHFLFENRKHACEWTKETSMEHAKYK